MQRQRLEFRGNAHDFFKVWIINLLLTIITFGLYSPWAKVRNNQYLYGNAYLGDHSFEYTANPFRILIGRLIVFGGYLTFSVCANIGHWEVATLIAAVFVLLIPFFIRQSVAFKRRYTRFRGVSFKHTASALSYYKATLPIFIILSIIVAIYAAPMLGVFKPRNLSDGFFVAWLYSPLIIYAVAALLTPYVFALIKRLIIGKTSYGHTSFEYNLKIGAVYFVFLKYSLIVLAFVVIPLIAIFDFYTDAYLRHVPTPLIILYFTSIFVFYAAKGAFDAWIGRVDFNNCSIGGFKTFCEYRARELAPIYIVNFFALLFSCGLLYPWVKVRVLKYKLENVGFENLDLDGFTGEIERQKGALGEETADFFDLDIGF
ncbi:MAG: DUF898 domain-containing protein [Helicobacteraceae bacterium]|jgi:uncharacterized membrane protein YjgN (DUF898 family)|nr:DUF898 domain-containing protein [Helicobacteraceae bacterium]